MPFIFDLFSDKEYCVITLPSTCTPGALLDHFTLVRASPASTFSHVLYILHRDTLSTVQHFRVVRYKADSYMMASRLLEVMSSDKEQLDIALKATHKFEEVLPPIYIYCFIPLILHSQVALKDNPKMVAFTVSVASQVRVNSLTFRQYTQAGLRWWPSLLSTPSSQRNWMPSQ